MLLRVILATIFLIPTVFSSALAQKIIIPDEFHVREAGGFAIKTWDSLGTKEAAAAVAATCAAFGGDCSQQALVGSRVARWSRDAYKSGSYTGTAEIIFQQGEEWHGQLYPFNAYGKEYVICKAGISDASHTVDSTFAAEIRNNGVFFYAVVPRNKPAGKWVSFRLVTEWVPRNQWPQSQCWPDKTNIAYCYSGGPQTCRFRRVN